MSGDRGGDLFTRRAYILSSLGGLFFSAIAARMAQLQIFENDEFRLEAAENQFNLLVKPASRGPVYDRFGIPLAVNRRDFRVSIMREDVDDLPKTINALASILRIPTDKAAAVLADARVAPRFMPALVAENLSWEEFSRVNVYSASYPGVRAEMGESRNYPLAESFAHVLGYVAKANAKDVETDPQARHPGIRVGKEGIERAQEAGLKGKHGATKVEVNARGRVIREVEDPRLNSVSGEAIVLTIDAELQQLAYDQFMASEGKPAESGAAVLLDLKTGDILALVSAPSFDPNKFVDGIGRADFFEYNTNERQPLYHKSVRGTYPPGSTYKLITTLAALEAGLVTPEEGIFCSGGINIGGNIFHCSSRRGHGTVHLHEAVKSSCDIYYYELGRRLGGERIGDMARKLGIGGKYDLGIPGVKAGYVADPAHKLATFKQPWTIGDTINSCIGQGLVAVSPLQLAIMAARVGSKGLAVEPRMIHEGPGATPIKAFASLGFDPKNIDLLHKGLVGVVNEAGGTARMSIDIEGMTIAGKTGTSQVRRITMAERRGGVRSNAALPWKMRDNALFVCYGPADNPRYACAVVVEHGGTGGKAAAPRAREIMRATLLKDPSSKPRFSAKTQTAAADPSPLAPLNAVPKTGNAKKGKA
jgi:penicillin-binding protein 2